MSIEFIRQSALDILNRSGKYNGTGPIPTCELIPNDFLSVK